MKLIISTTFTLLLAFNSNASEVTRKAEKIERLLDVSVFTKSVDGCASIQLSRIIKDFKALTNASQTKLKSIFKDKIIEINPTTNFTDAGYSLRVFYHTHVSGVDTCDRVVKNTIVRAKVEPSIALVGDSIMITPARRKYAPEYNFYIHPQECSNEDDVLAERYDASKNPEAYQKRSACGSPLSLGQIVEHIK